MIIEHIYWFAPGGLDGASTRYRGFYPLNNLSDKNVSSDFIIPSRTISGVLKFIQVYLSILLFRKKNSIVVIQKICSNRIYANLLKILILIRSSAIHYDIDDAEYLRQKTNTLHFFLRKSNVITVGSEELFKYCIRFNKNVFILTSPVRNHEFKKMIRNSVMNIGWVGDFGNGNVISTSFSHKTSLYSLLFPVLKELDFPIELTLIGVKNSNDIPEIIRYFKFNENINLNIMENLEWENDEWVYNEIAKFDIGLSPMNDHHFNQAKSAFKAKQYLSVGVPSIASNVGENNKFVKHLENGIICESNEEIKNALITFQNMSDEEYFKFSRNALKNKNVYSLESFTNRLLEIYK